MPIPVLGGILQFSFLEFFWGGGGGGDGEAYPVRVIVFLRNLDEAVWVFSCGVVEEGPLEEGGKYILSTVGIVTGERE